MERPTKITIQIVNGDDYQITCTDELTGSAVGMQIPPIGYEILKQHFKTGAMEISSDELSGLHKHDVNGMVCNNCGTKTDSEIHICRKCLYKLKDALQTCR